MKKSDRNTSSKRVIFIAGFVIVAFIILFLFGTVFSPTGNATKPSDWACSWKLSSKYTCSVTSSGVRVMEGAKICKDYNNLCSSAQEVSTYSCNKNSGNIWDMSLGTLVKVTKASCPYGCANNSCIITPPCIDADHDSYGQNCSPGPDCDDTNPLRNPQAIEVCDNIDNDCDSQVDENVRNACGTCGAVPTEVCADNIDNDCDSQVDEGCVNQDIENQIRAYQLTFDNIWNQNKNSFITQSLSGDSNDVYSLEFLVDGLTSMYEATGNTTYIDNALMIVENEISTARPVGADNRTGWLRPNGQSSFVDESRGAEYFSRLARVIKTNPQLNAVYGTRANNILMFVDQNILDKWLNDRSFGYPTGWEWVSRIHTDPPGTLSGYIQGHQILIALTVRNMDAAGMTGPKHGNQSWADLGNIVMSAYKSRLVVNPNGACTWDDGKFLWTDSKTGIIDTFHANEYPLAAITYYQDGVIMSSSDIQCLSKVFTRNVWNNKSDWSNPTQGPSGSIWFRNYINGADANFADQNYSWVSQTHPLYQTYGGMSGIVYAGWCSLGQYDRESYQACHALYTFVTTYSDTSANPIINRNSAPIGKLALSAHLAKDLRYKTW